MESGLSAYHYLCDLDQRCQARNVGLPQLSASEGWRGLGYRVGNHQLLSSYDDIAEILTLPETTTVPGGQGWLLGLANIRGNLLPVVDLKLFLEGERTVLREDQRMLIVRQPGGDVAVLIDGLFGQRIFGEQQAIDPTEVGEGRYGHFIQRAFHADGETWGVFDLSRLVRTPEFRQAAA